MLGFFPFLFFGAIVATMAYFQYQRRQARTKAVQALAARIGFTFAPDGYDIPDMPFSFFHQGDSRKAQLVISGTHNNLPLMIFDYRYCTGGGRSREVHQFTCGVLTIPAACPPLGLSHESAMSRIGEHLGLHDVQLEYDDFNRRFRVNCEQQKFAFAMLDGQMMQWLLSSDGFDRLEVVGPWVLIAGKQLDPAYWLNIGTWLDTFHTHVPPIVYSTYPRG